MCGWCGDGFRFEAVELGGPNSGRVKAVLHPISAQWEELYSQVSAGSLVVSTEDPSAEDIWAGSTGVYISTVNPDGSRNGLFGSDEVKFGGAGGGATTIGLKSIESFLDSWIMGGKSDPWTLRYLSTTGVVTVRKPVSSASTTPIYTETLPAGSPTSFAAWLVNMAQGNLIGEGFDGIKSLSGEVEHPLDGVGFGQAVDWWDFKNIGAWLRELVNSSTAKSIKYRLVHDFDNGYWSTRMLFSGTEQFGVARPYTIQSDREAKEYGLEVDAENKATRVYGIGSGEEGNTLYSIAYDADETNNRPERRATVAWKDQTVSTNLDALTQGYVLDHRDPVTVPSATIVGLPDPDPDAPGFNPQKGFPGPDICRPGDTFNISIGYGVITVRDLLVRNLGVSWNLQQDDPPERVLALQPVVRANNSVRTQTPVKNPAPTQPIPNTPTGPTVPVDPWPKAGLVVKVDHSALTEISGMEVSRVNPGNVALFNDEVNEYQVYLVSLATGKRTLGMKFSQSLPSAGDPEAIRWSKKSAKQVLADVGDNDNNRPTSGSNQPALYRFTEPKIGGLKTVTVDKLPIRFPGGASINCETLLIDPDTDQVFLVSKEPSRARVFSYGALSAMGTGSGDNVGQLVATLPLKLVADGCHTWSGDFVMFRTAGESQTYMYDPATWKQKGTIATPSMTKSEALAAESSCAFLTTTEGSNAPIYRVLLTKTYGATCGTTSGPTGGGTGTPPDPNKTVPGQVLNLNGWKLTLPTGSGNKPKEITQPALGTFENKPNFYTDDGIEVIFRAAVNGVTTSGSSYPRSELRQMKGNGTDLASWSNKNETWTMEGRMRFRHLPGTKPHVVGAQVHDSNDDVTVLRLEGSNLYVTKGDNTHYDLIDSSYTLNTWFTYKIVAKKGGGIDWYYNGTKVATIPGVVSGAYFKAGQYTQANESNGTGYGETGYSALKVTRTT